MLKQFLWKIYRTDGGEGRGEKDYLPLSTEFSRHFKTIAIFLSKISIRILRFSKFKKRNLSLPPNLSCILFLALKIICKKGLKNGKMFKSGDFNCFTETSLLLLES